MNQWMPIMDYAVKSGTSISTLRRQIKNNKIPFRMEKGKYLVLMQNTLTENTPQESAPAPKAQADFAVQVCELESELQQTKKEIAELKTLIAFYEEAIASHKVDS